MEQVRGRGRCGRHSETAAVPIPPQPPAGTVLAVPPPPAHARGHCSHSQASAPLPSPMILRPPPPLRLEASSAVSRPPLRFKLSSCVCCLLKPSRPSRPSWPEHQPLVLAPLSTLPSHLLSGSPEGPTRHVRNPTHPCHHPVGPPACTAFLSCLFPGLPQPPPCPSTHSRGAGGRHRPAVPLTHALIADSCTCPDGDGTCTRCIQSRSNQRLPGQG